MSAPGFTPLSSTPAPYGATDLALDVPDALRVQPREDLRDPVDPQVFVNEYTRPLPTYEETFSGPGYEAKPAPTSGFAVAALVCGIVGVFTLVPALAAIVLGHAGLWRTRSNTHSGRGLAIGGMVLGYAVSTVVALVILATWIASP
ncbi:DUF4190 domain-containing protein [Pseudactinotalea terrae]|uniref:DUF4190 domain-containing protein n=1 Tax=Pseudactinotalea terrae TaxID=1743262 RepID=UPI0013916470|nr:DUF4190 domain-containing protein [Pseudactinotalea terrae]